MGWSDWLLEWWLLKNLVVWFSDRLSDGIGCLIWLLFFFVLLCFALFQNHCDLIWLALNWLVWIGLGWIRLDWIGLIGWVFIDVLRYVVCIWSSDSACAWMMQIDCCLLGWLMDGFVWLTEWSVIDRLIDWLVQFDLIHLAVIDWDWLVDWFSDWMIDWCHWELIDWMIGWLID